MSNQLLADLEMHLSKGRFLFPLKKINRQRKTPLHKKYHLKKYTKEQLESYIKQGHGIGWRLGENDLVIDYDPRDASEVWPEFKKQIEQAIGEPLEKHTVCVLSGGQDKGQHYYFKTDKLVRTKLQNFKGIQIRRRGLFVVLPGSLHPVTGNPYRWDPNSKSPDSEIPKAPQWLIDQLSTTGKTETKRAVSFDEVKHYLDQLDPTNFQSRQEWLEIGFCVHHALGDDGKYLFLDWSARDEQYTDCDEENEKIWESIHNETDNPQTFASLVRRVKDNGGSLFIKPSDFESLADDEETEIAETKTRLTEIEKLVIEAMTDGPLVWEALHRKKIQKQTKATLKEVDTVYRECKRRAKEAEKEADQSEKDITQMMAEMTLATHFKKGRYLVHASNQTFYRFDKTHWVQVLKNEMMSYVMTACEKNEVTKYTAPNVGHAVQLLMGRTADLERKLSFSETRNVINTQNKEIHLDPITGEYEVKPHRPQSYLLNCLDVEYDTKAECPIFDFLLGEIFANASDPDDMIRHFWEFAGYLIQTNKNIPSYWILKGNGSNGKSFVMDILVQLVGLTNCLSEPIVHFEDTNTDNHIISRLVGKLLLLDDDSSSKKTLPESALKRLCENKLQTANPKFENAFMFESHVTPVILTNPWPKVSDLSWGMIRRAYVMPFDVKFEKKESDLNLKAKVKHELPGILNQALKGLQRLRERGVFKEPTDCKEAKEKWIMSGNSLYNYLRKHVKRTGNGESIELEQLYSRYRFWCREVGGVKFSLSLPTFESNVELLDLTVAETGGIKHILGLTYLDSDPT